MQNLTTLDLINLQGDYQAIATALNDIATVLMMIAKGDLQPYQVKALATITADNCNDWIDIADHRATQLGELIKGGDDE